MMQQATSSAAVQFSTMTARRVAQLAGIAMVGAVYFVVVLVVFHFLRSDYDPIRRVMSNYAVGPYGLLMTTAYLADAVSKFALGLGLYQGMTPATRSRLGMILLGIAGLGVVVGAIFPTDVTPNDAPVTWVGGVHVLSGLIGFLCLLAAMFFLSQRFKKDARWQAFSRTSLALAFATLAAFVAFVIIQATNIPIGGIGQRVFIALCFVWLFLTAIRLRTIAQESLAT